MAYLGVFGRWRRRHHELAYIHLTACYCANLQREVRQYIGELIVHFHTEGAARTRSRVAGMRTKFGAAWLRGGGGG